MRVLHVLPTVSSTFGGPTSVAIGSVRHLRASGVDAEIVTTTFGVSLPKGTPLGTQVEWEGVPVTFLPASRIRFGAFIPSIPLAIWLKRNVALFDLVDLHYLFTFSTSVASRIAVAKGIPFTVRLMGQCEPWAIQHHGLRKKVYQKLIDTHLFTAAAAVQTTSQMEHSNAAMLGIPTLACVPLGVDPPDRLLPDAPSKLREMLNIPSAAPILLYLSRLDPKKRLDRVVRLLAKLQLKTDAHLVVCGEGSDSYNSAIHQLAREEGVAERIKFLGHVGGEVKELALCGADLMVLLSESENFACSVAEGLVRGLPVLVSDTVGIAEDLLGQYPEMITHTPDTATDAALRLLSFCATSTNARQDLSDWARMTFGWERRVQGLKSLYEMMEGSSIRSPRRWESNR